MNKLTDIQHTQVKIYSRVRAGTTQSAVRVLFEWVDNAFLEDRMDEAEEFFKTLDLSLLDSNLVVAVLNCANWRRSDLKAWDNLFMRSVWRLMTLIPDRALKILQRFNPAFAPSLIAEARREPYSLDGEYPEPEPEPEPVKPPPPKRKPLTAKDMIPKKYIPTE